MGKTGKRQFTVSRFSALCIGLSIESDSAYYPALSPRGPSATMRIETAIQAVHSLPAPNGWVRLEQVGKAPDHLELLFGIHNENRKRRKTGRLKIVCRGVREAHITDFDGGGLGLYPTSHPAARQYTSQQSEVRWISSVDKALVLGTLHQYHFNAVGDWIPFDRYVSLKAISKKKCIFRGPSFLMRVYAQALRASGESPHVTRRKSAHRKRGNLKVLHFGDSFVVAADFQVVSEIKPL